MRSGRKMVKLVYGLMQSLDGYVAGPEEGPGLGAPNEELFRHFIEQQRGLAGCLYGRRIYEVLRYWDEDRPEFSDIEREFGEVWRSKPKWVASRTLKNVGPNASLVEGDLESFVVGLKKDLDDNHDDGSATEIEVAGPTLAAALSEHDLIDEYRLYLQPVALGAGKPFFAAARSKLRLAGVDRIGQTVRLSYEADR